MSALLIGKYGNSIQWVFFYRKLHNTISYRIVDSGHVVVEVQNKTLISSDRPNIICLVTQVCYLYLLNVQKMTILAHEALKIAKPFYLAATVIYKSVKMHLAYEESVIPLIY